ncbi:TorD/DmsD family molecular chaperone [Adlercreutzia agrestimuris]|uniref:TorD/DmsD family molecular chaperone n=1 Tax=Adlercreutzia agrestimuris TaxID=2941324 RepID=UPI00203FCC46|nr:molecular chaperone TorD family protein [Adlercreutzia agrestimuris]
MTEQMDTNVWQVRAALCELLALSFRYPDSVLAEVVSSGEWVDAANELALAAGVDWAADVQESADQGDAEQMLHALRAEATRLFIGAPEPVISPYEGIWRAADDGGEALLFINPHSMEVERFCKSCGLSRPAGTNEPLDNVATELELLECLAARVALGEDADAAASAYAEFMTSHVMQWMPRFAEKVQEETRLTFYRQAALLLARSLDVLV